MLSATEERRERRGTRGEGGGRGRWGVGRTASKVGLTFVPSLSIMMLLVIDGDGDVADHDDGDDDL